MWSRYWGLKQIDSFWPNWETILEYSIYDAIRAWFDHVVLIIRESFYDQFKEVLGGRFEKSIKVSYVFQEVNPKITWFENIQNRTKPWWTWHAVLSAREVVNWNFCVINADDYYWVDWFRQMHDWLSNNCKENTCSLVWYILKNTLSENGTVNRGICEVDENWKLLHVAERLKLKRSTPSTVVNPNWVTLVDDSIASMNFWWFHSSFFDNLEKEFYSFLENHWMDDWYEFYIPSAANSFSKKIWNYCDVMISQDKRYWVTYSEDKPITQKAILKLVENWIYPNKLWEK